MKTDDRKLQLAWNLLDEGKYQQGMVLLLPLPESEQRCNELARCLTEMGKFKEARKVLNSGLKKFPASDALWVAKGNLHLALEDYSEALKCFQRAILLSPDHNSTALYATSLASERLGRFDEAIRILDSLIKGDSEDVLYLIERGHCAVEVGCPQDALPFYQKAKNMLDNSVTFQEKIALYSGLATVYIELQMKKEALEVALDGLKTLSGGHPVLYFNAGICLSNMGMSSEAMEVLKRGLKTFPDDEDLKELLKELEDDADSPEGGGTKPLLGLVLLALLIRNRLLKK